MTYAVSRVIAVALAIALTGLPVSIAAQQEELTSAMASYTAALESLASAQQKAPPALESLGIHGFSVALVLGDMQGTATADNVPAGAKKALSDMRDFLPYKSYKLIDAQWILCCGGAFGPVTSVSGRLRGTAMPGSTDEQEYAFTVTVTAAQGQRLSIRFSLRDATGTKNTAPKETYATYGDEAPPNALQQNKMAQLIAERELAQAKERYGAGHAAVKEIEMRITQLKIRAAQIEQEVGLRRSFEGKITNTGGKSIMDSTFSMDVGETVVIGTSSLKGDKALIAVLTAAQRPAGVTKTQR